MRMFLWEETEAKGAPQEHHGPGYGPWALRRDDGHPGKHPGSCAVFGEGGARLEGKASGGKGRQKTQQCPGFRQLPSSVTQNTRDIDTFMQAWIVIFIK